jgi:hypothetical protein
MKPTREEIADVIKDLLLSGYTVGIGMEPIIAKHLEKALDKGWREGSFEHLKGLTREETELERLVDRIKAQTTIEGINTLKKWSKKH